VPPGRLQPTPPRDLETICLKCLEKDSRKRYASAGDLKADLDRYLRGEPILARPLGRVARLGRWCRRKPLIAGLSAALIGAVTVGLVSTLVLWILAERRADVARAKREEAERSFRRGLAAVNEFLNRIPQEELANAQGMQPLQRELLEAALKFYEEFLDERRDDATLGLGSHAPIIAWRGSTNCSAQASKPWPPIAQPARAMRRSPEITRTTATSFATSPTPS
jgi:serine/threonine-protein kinase